MPPVDRSALRNTYIYASKNRTAVLGGLWATNSVTNADLYSMVENFCSMSNPFYLHDDSERVIARNGQQLRPGNYYIVTDGPIVVTDEFPLNRLISLQTGTRVGSFRSSARERNQRCILSGEPATLGHAGRWRGFEAAHIFPLAYLGKWNDYNYDSIIDFPPAIASHGPMNSIQNGILLTRVMHAFFDAYEVAINPDV
ncbi:hypothetical protein HOY80DRAFT_1045733 [Tuber brumale]|nr:hypothetical protein HOY80DRAFT_1045733 [Tuber brumale]